MAGSMHRSAPCVPSLSHARSSLWSSVSAARSPTTRRHGRQSTAARPVKAATIAAAEAPTPDVLTLTGMIAADQRSEVTADTQGKVIDVMVERGQRVKMGQPVVQLDVRNAALSAREAQANLAVGARRRSSSPRRSASARRRCSTRARSRAVRVRPPEHAVHVGAQQVAPAQARTEMMAKSVADGLVRAPFDGMVTEKNVVARRVGRARPPLFTLVDDDPLQDRAVGARGRGPRDQEGPDASSSSRSRSPARRTARRSRGIGGRDRQDAASLIVEATIDKARPSWCPACSPRRTSRSARSPRPVVPPRPSSSAASTWHAFVVVKGERPGPHRPARPRRPAPGKVSILQGIDARATRSSPRSTDADHRRPATVAGVRSRHAVATQYLRPAAGVRHRADPRARRRRRWSATAPRRRQVPQGRLPARSRSSRRTPARRRPRSRPTSPQKIEEAVNTVSGLDTLTSISTEGVSLVIAQFDLEVDPDKAVEGHQRAPRDASCATCRRASRPEVRKADPDAAPVIVLVGQGPDGHRRCATSRGSPTSRSSSASSASPASARS